MKMNQWLTMCGIVAALSWGASDVLAQNGGGGGGGGGGGFGGGRNFDPAAMQQRIMDNVREQLNFTNDTDWSAVQPLVQKVMDARRDTGPGAGMARLFGRGRGGQNGGGGRGGFGPQPSPEAEALQNALDQNAPTAQVKDLLAKYEASQKDKIAKLQSAQTALRSVLSPKQEAQATLLGLLD